MRLYQFFLFLLIIPFNTQSEQLINSYVLVDLPETRVKIAVIDTGIVSNDETKPYLCKGKHYDLTGTGIQDENRHGTNVAGLIAKQINPEKVCLLIIKYYQPNGYNLHAEVTALNIAMQQNVKYINFSSGGEEKHWSEREIISKVLERKIYFVAAAGNKNDNLLAECNYYPACYSFASKYFRIVGNGLDPKRRFSYSNYGGPVTDWRDGVRQTGFGITMTGTSQSAAVLTGEIAAKENP